MKTNEEWDVAEVGDDAEWDDIGACTFEWDSPNSRGRWCCCRAPKHTGQHVATDGVIVCDVHPA